MDNKVVSLALKYAAAGGLIGSLFYLVLTGKIQASDYQTLAVGALGALGGFHAGASLPADHSGDITKMVAPTNIADNPTLPKEG